RERAGKMGIKDPRKKYEIGDMVKGDCLFAATGVTNGALLTGVRFRKDVIETETVVMRSIAGTVRWVRGEHRQLEKFHLDCRQCRGSFCCNGTSNGFQASRAPRRAAQSL